MKMIGNLDSGKKKNLNLLEAILLIEQAWQNVTQDTISHCFSHAGFKELDLNLSTNEDTSVQSDIATLTQKLDSPLSRDEVVEFIEADSNVVICAEGTDEDIIEGILGDDSSDDEIAEIEKDEEKEPTLNEAMTAAATLKKFFLFHKDFTDTHKENFGKIEW